MLLPTPRGPLSQTVIHHLRCDAPLHAEHIDDLARHVATVRDPCTDDDLHLALATCYELHYRGFDEVDDRWEWDLGLLAVRAHLEDSFESELVKIVPRRTMLEEPIDRALRRLLDETSGPSVSNHLLKRGTVEEYRGFLAQRSVYHLKEADPHTWAIPRLSLRPKAALVEIQADEYGGGDPGRMHAGMFARAMRALDLDDTYGAYWDHASGSTLATVNLMSMFGLHRRFRGAILGHLAALEMDSTSPNRRYAGGLRRLGYGSDATAYFDEHVEADAVHEQVAAVDMCGSFVADEPGLGPDVLWGAACGVHADLAAGADMLRSWGVDQTVTPG
jgi:hypothetical protein